MSLTRYCLLPLLLIAVCVHARPHKRATDYFDNSPYQDEGIAIDFVTIAHTSATVEPRNPGGDVKTNRINSFMSTLSQLNDSSGVVQWFRSVW